MILLSFSFIVYSCENKIENGNNTNNNNETNYADDVYLINELSFTLDIEVFIGGKSSKFTLIPLEATYFTTIEYTLYEGDKINEFPGDVEYRSFLNSIDSVNVFCLAQKHTYVKSDNKTFQLFGNYEVNEKGWIIKFDEAKRAQFGWGDNIEDILVIIESVLSEIFFSKYSKFLFMVSELASEPYSILISDIICILLP